ncbi:PRC-barrel domain containing protein [Starkeya sp. ORNL1]|uniref:PRC-barrel domain-containing protein n=1 Tax=Starkeya sp. ORNL1 TaxID=2709380 RepID=UPI0014641B85|nr:PRC-barrel domain-containing protein [Starkeya sp. ORNL1]QJP17322.1 PRC-barrel domain containing protein [Starkeya sp. ORNL1]
MDHSTHVRLTDNELTPSNLEDATIYGPDDEEIGSVSHMHGTGASAQVVIDVGGFLGIGAKPVAVPISNLDFMRDEDGDVHAVTTWTKDELKAMSEHHDS